MTFGHKQRRERDLWRWRRRKTGRGCKTRSSFSLCLFFACSFHLLEKKERRERCVFILLISLLFSQDIDRSVDLSRSIYVSISSSRRRKKKEEEKCLVFISLLVLLEVCVYLFIYLFSFSSFIDLPVAKDIPHAFLHASGDASFLFVCMHTPGMQILLVEAVSLSLLIILSLFFSLSSADSFYGLVLRFRPARALPRQKKKASSRASSSLSFFLFSLERESLFLESQSIGLKVAVAAYHSPGCWGLNERKRDTARSTEKSRWKKKGSEEKSFPVVLFFLHHLHLSISVLTLTLFLLPFSSLFVFLSCLLLETGRLLASKNLSLFSLLFLSSLSRFFPFFFRQHTSWSILEVFLFPFLLFSSF